MSELHYKNRRKKRSNKGFYIALGVCLIAVGLAVWTTYDSVVQYISPEESNPEEPSSAAPADKTVSGVKVESSEAASEKESESKPESKPEPVSSQESSLPTDSTPVQEAATLPTNEAYAYPLTAEVYKPYSDGELVYSITMKDWRIHTGTDFSAKLGDTVRSAGAGVVKEIYEDEKYGNVLVISCAAYDFYYCGLGNTLLVKVGDNVVLGQDIGSVGLVPCESIETPHLHFEVRESGELVNPADIF